MKRAVGWLLAGAALAGGCASTGGDLAPRATLEVRAAQTRHLVGASREAAMAAVVQGLQDAGFQVRNASRELGLVNAVSERGAGGGTPTWVRVLFWAYSPLFPKSRTEVVELTATVTETEGSARVRLLAQRKTVGDGGEVKESRLVEEPELYQQIFARIDKALFLERQGL